MQLQANVRLFGQQSAQRRRVGPAGLRVEQPAGRQADAGFGFGTGLVEVDQQIAGEGGRQLRLALHFLGVEGQLQYPAIVPVDAFLQLFEQAAGVAETTDDQARECRAVGRQLEVEHALRVARGFLGDSRVAFQQGHLPAAGRQAGRGGATGQSRAYDQGPAFEVALRRAGEPGFAGACSAAEKLAFEDFPLVAQARHPAHLETGVIQAPTHVAGAGEGAEAGAGGA
ncbi:hypothetical protein D9M68_732310 [compost metagenome]